jgi:hypothetical protein
MEYHNGTLLRRLHIAKDFVPCLKGLRANLERHFAFVDGGRHLIHEDLCEYLSANLFVIYVVLIRLGAIYHRRAELEA